MDTESKTPREPRQRIEELQAEISNALAEIPRLLEAKALPPALNSLARLVGNAPVRVTLRRLIGETQCCGRKIRADADADANWQPGEGMAALIGFGSAPEEPGGAASGPSAQGANLVRDAEVASSPLAELLAVVDREERSPRRQFVGLKFLKERLLPALGGRWADPRTCEEALVDAIQRGLLRTGKVANPRNPEFPVTSVSLNREHPEVGRLLRPSRGPAPPDFAPIDLPGRPLSQDILDDRR